VEAIMTTFDDLQSRFFGSEFRVFGLPSDSGRALQPATAFVRGDDQALWSWFNIIPGSAPLFEPSSSEFFSAYSAVIDSLIPGQSPFDPIRVAKKKLTDWGSAPPAWSIDYADMQRLLAAAPATHFPFQNGAAPETGFWGLWADSSTVYGPTALVADGAVDMTLSFANLLSFNPTPADWYLSSALSNAYSNPGKAPWDPSSPITWQTTFGPGGALARFVSSLIVVKDLRIQYTSSVEFGAIDQALILASASSGLWPHYLDASNASTEVGFDSTGRMTVRITSERDQPIGLAASVVSAANYLGLA
jgi:hypothetical protein